MPVRERRKVGEVYQETYRKTAVDHLKEALAKGLQVLGVVAAIYIAIFIATR